ncbi:hypothetical protein [Cypionkella sp.]|uniref:hypothetical protein n=1 Tax=Cypionkella sp. TaxID=2811411 RepID=UPI00262ADCBC|nr:hypothetical protein [Cypionkella sp.]MDB5665765.1 hypothetical protein [Cypionkella sp.]
MAEKIEVFGAKLTLYRDAPAWDGLASYAVGQFSCPSAEAGAALLNHVATMARSEGAQALVGPMDGDTWHSYRLVIESDGRAPFLMEPVGKPHDSAAFTGAGFTPISAYFSASVPAADVGTGPQPTTDGLHIAAWDGSEPEALFTQVHALSCAAFSKNPFYKPIVLADFLPMYMPFVPMMKPELVLFCRDDAGALVGFLFGIPNYAEGPKPASAILKTYASLKKGAGHALSTRFYTAARELGFTTVIHALMHEDNLSALRSSMNGAQVFRRYALMGRRLD